MLPLNRLYTSIAIPKKIVITMHQKPDGDAMGSALGLYHFLTNLDHNVTVISPTNWATFLNWMPGCKFVLDYEKETAKADTCILEAEWIFCLDFNILSRTRKMEAGLLAAPGQRDRKSVV